MSNNITCDFVLSGNYLQRNYTSCMTRMLPDTDRPTSVWSPVGLDVSSPAVPAL